MVVAEPGLLRGALVAVLDAQADFRVVAEAAPHEDVPAAARSHRPDLAVVDIDGTDDPAELVGRVHRPAPDCAVVALTGRPTARVLRRALGARVRGVLCTDLPPAELVEQLRVVASGQSTIDPVAALAALAAAVNPLTDREREVLVAVADGLSSRQIAGRLFLAPGTVRNLVSGVLRKTGARNRWEAVDRARDAGWI
jgi:two-component system response regulator DesR